MVCLPPSFKPAREGACSIALATCALCLSRKVGRSIELVLVRNHEIGATSAANFPNAPGVYDNGTSSPTTTNKFGGGNTNLLFRDGNWVSMTPSLNFA
jgi:hypothetical protein